MFRTSLQNNIVEVSKVVLGTSLVVQWLRLHASNTVSPGLTPGQATRFHMLQVRPSTAKIKKKIFFLNKIKVLSGFYSRQSLLSHLWPRSPATFSPLLLVMFCLLKSGSPVHKSAPLWFSLGYAFLVVQSLSPV